MSERKLDYNNKTQMYTIEVSEIPGCVVEGSTFGEALDNADDTVARWVADGNKIVEEQEGELLESSVCKYERMEELMLKCMKKKQTKIERYITTLCLFFCAHNQKNLMQWEISR